MISTGSVQKRESWDSRASPAKRAAWREEGQESRIWNVRQGIPNQSGLCPDKASWK